MLVILTKLVVFMQETFCIHWAKSLTVDWNYKMFLLKQFFSKLPLPSLLLSHFLLLMGFSIQTFCLRYNGKLTSSLWHFKKFFKVNLGWCLNEGIQKELHNCHKWHKRFFLNIFKNLLSQEHSTYKKNDCYLCINWHICLGLKYLICAFHLCHI